MSLSNEEFARLVAKFEARATSDRAGYARNAVLLAMLGNLYLGFIVALLSAVALALLASVFLLKTAALGIKLALVVCVLLWSIVRALWVPQGRPSGIALTPAQAPELFRLLEGLYEGVHTARVHEVLVTGDFNAGVVQVPRLGAFGWSRNYLLIGLPMMATLSVEEFRAVLGHELGHVSRSHGRVGNWVYMQRLRWHRLQELFRAQPSKAEILFRPFLRWYAPYFLAYSFPLARANEYEADAASARLTSPRQLASALVRTRVTGRYLEREYWPGLYRQSDHHATPGFLPYAELAGAVATRFDAGQVQGWTTEAMEERTGIADTHPSLADRLAALGEEPRLEPFDGPDAASALLGVTGQRLTAELDQRWRSQVKASWEQNYRRAEQGRNQLAELAAQEAGGTELSLQQQFDRAMLLERVGQDPDGAFAHLQALNARLPEDAVVNLALGARMLSRQDPAGTDLVRKAMALDPALTGEACEILRDDSWRRGEQDAAHDWHRKLITFRHEEDAGRLERGRVLLADRFERHGLDSSSADQLKAALKPLKARGLSAAYYVRKHVRHHPERPMYVFAFRISAFRWLGRKEVIRDLQKHISEQVAFPGQTLVISVNGSNYRFGRKLRWMRGSRLL